MGVKVHPVCERLTSGYNHAPRFRTSGLHSILFLKDSVSDQMATHSQPPLCFVLIRLNSLTGETTLLLSNRFHCGT